MNVKLTTHGESSGAVSIELPARIARHAALLLFSLAASISVFLPRAASAHHEAIFGPQSSLVFSEPGYLSTQLFSRSIGAPGDKIQETTGVVSGGYSPFADVPRSFNFIQPFSYIKNFDQRTSQTGFG